MASNNAYTLFLIALLVFASSKPLAQGQEITLHGLSVGGNLCCTSNGNCPGQGVAGAIVYLNCSISGAATTVGLETTNVNGSFNITLPAFQGLKLGLPRVPCVAFVELPLDSVVCPILSTTNGVLVSTIRSLGTIVTSTLELVQNATLNGFFNVGF